MTATDPAGPGHDPADPREDDATGPADPTDEGRDAEEESSSGGSTLSVALAFAANVLVGILKLVAGLLTGSSAMLAEAAHSAADCVTEVLLFTALRRSGRQADRVHPFGYGKERFFWALIAAVSIFVSGAVFAAYEGIRTMFGESEEQTLAWIAYAVLGVSFVLEGTSWLQAVRQLRNEARNDETTPLRWLRETDDPTVKTVFFEDSAALIGLLLAFGGVGLHQLTGSAFWDGLASVLIAVLLTAVAYILGGTNKGLLIGRQADRRTVYELRDALAERPEVEQVVDLLTMMIGTDRILLCARLDFDDTLDAATLERTCANIDIEMRDRFPELQDIFIEPVPRSDPAVRQRVLDRYGAAGAERLRTGLTSEP
jgi:cation diffusion facilitator family transporter